MVRWKKLPDAAVIAAGRAGTGTYGRASPGTGRYGNVTKPTVDGIKFDSGSEMQRYLELKLLEKAGVIQGLVLQPRFPIEIGGVKVMSLSKRYHRTGRQVTYVADFWYWDNEKSKRVVEDVKMKSGHRPDVYRLKRALVYAMGIEITEV